MLDEKRAQSRLQMDLLVLYKVSNHQSAVIKKAMTRDVSNSGICFYTDTFHEKGTNLQIMLPHIFDSPKSCTVVWRSEKYNERYKIGARFLQAIY